MKLIAATVVVSVSFAVGAETYTWNNSTAGLQQWGTPANWQNGSAVATVAPTNGQDVVISPNLAATDYQQIVSTGILVGDNSQARIANGAVDPKVGTVIGGSSRVDIQHGEHTVTASQPERHFRIEQAKDFLGFWRAGNGKSFFDLISTVDRITELGALLTVDRPRVQVPTAGTAARIAEIDGHGALQKTGAGELEVAAAPGGADTVAYVGGGTLTLSGDDEAELAQVLKLNAFHLDASLGSSLVVSNGNGYAWVNQWSDADGRTAIHATRPTPNPKGAGRMPWTQPAYIATEVSPTGRALVSFGSGSADNQKNLGPSNCCLRLDSAITTVKEVFYAVDYPVGAQFATVMGGEGTMHFVSESYLFSDFDNGGVRPIRAGELRVDGSRRVLSSDLTTDDTASMKGMHVVSVAPSIPLTISLLGSDRYCIERSGASRLGEVLVFTNALTRAQRALVNRHLMAKWLSGEKLDAKAALVATGAKVGVAAGRVSSVREVTVSGELVKTGAGTLRVGSVADVSGTPSVTVENGQVAFADMSDSGVVPTGPAADPYLWVSTTDAASLRTTTSEYARPADATLVTEWRDCRGDDYPYLRCPSTTGAWNCPTRVAIPTKATFKGRTVVDFGTCASGDYTNVTRMITSTQTANERKEYAGFMVVRILEPHYRSLFSSMSFALYRNDEKRLIANNYENSWATDGTWTIDGRIVDPISDWWNAQLNDTENLRVLAFQLDRPTEFNQILQDRNWASNHAAAGRAQVAEVIIYRRRLTDRERRDTEAYLMNKWQGNPHPARTAAVALDRLTFGAQASPVVDTEVPLTVEMADGTDGTLVKRGTGSADIASYGSTNHFSSVRVEAGELVYASDAPDFADALYHLDASDLDSFTTSVTDNGAKTNVLKWLDVRRNGFYAQSAVDYKQAQYCSCTANPTLQYVRMPDGAIRPCVDFGMSQVGSGEADNDHTAAGMLFFNDGVARFTNVKEVHVLWADHNIYSASGPYSVFVGDTSGASFYRGSQCIVDNSSATRSVAWGYIATNGVVTTCSAKPALDEFMLFSFVPTSDVAAGTICQNRGSGAAGGAQICEKIAFGRQLSDLERSYLQKLMMSKWLGTEAPVWECAVANLHVAAGARLKMRTNFTLAAGNVTGGGTIDSAETSVNGAIELAWRSLTDHDVLTLPGKLTLKAGASIQVSCSLAKLRDLPAGRHPVVSAGTLVCEAEPVLTVTGVPASKGSVRLVKDGNVYCLDVPEMGFRILMR